MNISLLKEKIVVFLRNAGQSQFTKQKKSYFLCLFKDFYLLSLCTLLKRSGLIETCHLFIFNPLIFPINRL